MLLADELLVMEYVNTHQNTSNQEYTSLCNKDRVGPETLHRNWSLPDKMRLPKRPHKDPISDQSNNPWHLNGSKFHQHVNSITKYDHDSDNKYTVGADPLQEKQSNEPKCQSKEYTSECLGEQELNHVYELVLFCIHDDLVCDLEYENAGAVVE